MYWSGVYAIVSVQLRYGEPCEYEGQYLRWNLYWFCESFAHPVEAMFQHLLYDVSFERASLVLSRLVLRDRSDAFLHQADGSFWRGRWGVRRLEALRRLANASVAHDSVWSDLGYWLPWERGKEDRAESVTGRRCFEA